MTSIPSLADLDQATARTQATLDDPSATWFDRVWAAEREAALYDRWPAEPDLTALEAHEAEMEEPEAS